jgi:hypothetical protein
MPVITDIMRTELPHSELAYCASSFFEDSMALSENDGPRTRYDKYCMTRRRKLYMPNPYVPSARAIRMKFINCNPNEKYLAPMYWATCELQKTFSFATATCNEFDEIMRIGDAVYID